MSTRGCCSFSGAFKSRLLAPGDFIDKTENEFSLAPRVAGVDDFGNVGAVHEVF